MAPLTCQYDDYPQIPIAEAPKESEQDDNSKKVTKLIYVAIGVVVLVIVYFVFFSGGGSQTIDDSSEDVGTGSSSDEIPEIGTDNNDASNDPDLSAKCDLSKENCFDNPVKCKCVEGEFCSKETKKCIAPVCGNENCEPGEYADNCCEDCGCTSAGCEVCNSSTHICSVTETGISDEKAIEAAEEYFLDKGVDARNVSIESPICFGSNSFKVISAEVKGSETIREVMVSGSGEVSDYIRV